MRHGRRKWLLKRGRSENAFLNAWIVILKVKMLNVKSRVVACASALDVFIGHYTGHHQLSERTGLDAGPIKQRADAQAPAPMVDSHENWNHLIIRRFSLKVDSRENENTQKLFSHEEVVFSFYG